MRRSINGVLKKFFFLRRSKIRRKFERVLPVNELFTDRWEKAQFLGFGEGSSIYDSSCVFGKVEVGKNTWIGPYTILDGSGGLSIGDNCSISAGVHIYTHDTVRWAVSGGLEPYEYATVNIGDNCFIGPQSIVQKGVVIGVHSILAANSFLKNDLPAYSIAAGNPAKIIGQVSIHNNKVELKYNDRDAGVK